MALRDEPDDPAAALPDGVRVNAGAAGASATWAGATWAGADRRGRAAALDVGRARIGVAVTSARGDQALAHSVLERRGTRTDIARLLPLLASCAAEVLVVGLPRALEGEDSSARLARQFAAALATAQPRPVVLVDESDTTAEAHADLRQLGLRAARRRSVVDMHAAKQILDRWLGGAAAEPVAALDDPRREG